MELQQPFLILKQINTLSIISHDSFNVYTKHHTKKNPISSRAPYYFCFPVGGYNTTQSKEGKRYL